MPSSIPILTVFLLFSNSLFGQDCDARLMETKINNLLATGQFEQADAIAIDWHQCADSLQIQSDKYWATIYLTQAARNRRKYKSAYRQAQKAHTIWKHLPAQDQSEDAFHYLILAETAVLANEFELSKTYLQEAEIRLDSYPETDYFLHAYHAFVSGYFHQHGDNQYDLAKESFQKALEILLLLPAPPTYLIGQTLRWLGTTNRIEGDFEKALYFYQRELFYYEAAYSHDHKELANTNYNIGAVQYELLQYEEALQSFLKTHAIWKTFREPDDKFMRYLNEAIGDMYWELGNREKTLEFYDLAVAGEEKINNDLSLAMLDKGDTLFASGNHNQAMQHFQQALDWRLGMFGQQHAMSGACQNFIGKKYFEAGNLDAAIAAYQRTILMMVPQMTDSTIYANPSSHLHAISEQNLLEALASKGIAFANRYHQKKQIADLNAAFETLQLALFWMEKLRVSPVSESAKAFWSGKYFKVFEKMIDVALTQYEITGDPKYYHLAFEASEKSKAFLLLAALQSHELGHMAGVPDSIVIKEHQLRQAITEYSGKINLEQQRCGEARGRQLDLWQEKLLALTAEHEAFTNKIADKYPAFHALKYDVQTIPIPELQSSLLADGKSCLLEVFEGDDQVFLFFITANDIAYHRINDKAPYRFHLSELLENIKSPALFLQFPEQAYQQFTSNAYAFYELLFPKDIKSIAQVDQLFVIPDGQLFFFPFECLLTQLHATDQRNYQTLPYLLQKSRLAYSQSATLLHQSHFSKSKKKYESSLIAFAPDYGTVLYESIPMSPLYNNQQEAKKAADLFDGKVLLKNKATETAFMDAAQKAGILHLAAHTWLDHEQPMLSRILFSPDEREDGQLHGFELYALRTSAQLAILSACNTAIGKIRKGEGMMSIERGFQYAGCPSLLSTLWVTEDAAAADLTLLFLEKLKNGQSKNLALQSAQLEFLENADPATTHPFYWAGFRLSGDTSPLENPADFYIWWLAVLAMIIAFVIAWKKKAMVNT